MNKIVIGVLGRAQQRYGVLCCDVVFVTTHWHALVWVEDAEQLARFLQYVNGKLGKEVGRLVGRRHGIRPAVPLAHSNARGEATTTDAAMR